MIGMFVYNNIFVDRIKQFVKKCISKKKQVESLEKEEIEQKV